MMKEELETSRRERSMVFKDSSSSSLNEMANGL
jgi:hypothetical protein